ncbi:MAG: phosphoribosylformylglycinamidine synthase subunit PurQ [Pirellulales bacterium]
MASPRVLILRAPGTNCDAETAHAFSLAGAAPEEWHVNRLLESPRRLADFQIFCVPGGFSYGDDLSAGRIFGSKICHHLAEPLEEFRTAGKLILGVCNGFQVLLKTNLLAAPDSAGPTATLALNDSGHFEARWVSLSVTPGNCVFLQGIEQIELPVAHAEGRFVARDAAVLAQMESAGRIVVRYQSRQPNCSPSLPVSPSPHLLPPPLVPYPDNPNGAMADVAGICDATGRVFGLMPHPERFIDPTQHPRWTRGPAREMGDGLRIFQNAVRFFL